MYKGYICNPEQYLDDRDEPVMLSLVSTYTRDMHMQCHETIRQYSTGWLCYLNTTACRTISQGESDGELIVTPVPYEVENWRKAYFDFDVYNGPAAVKRYNGHIPKWSSPGRNSVHNGVNFCRYLAMAQIRQSNQGEG